MTSINLKDNIYWVGALEPEMRIFDIVFKADHGTSYNSYLIKDEKTVLIDTVKGKYTDQFIAKIHDLADPLAIDYIIVSHSEPDHSGALQEILRYAKNAKIIASKSGGHLLKSLLTVPFDLIKIDDCPLLNIGTYDLQFISAPYLHWPDSMFTYVKQEKILFTCDVFSAHYCDERIFDDLMPNIDSYEHYYFDCIMRPFKSYALKAIEKIKDLKIDIIATGHGPILRKNPRRNIENWLKWSKLDLEGRKNILILYTSIYGNTKKMAHAIAKGASSRDADIKLIDIMETDFQAIRDDIEKADGILIGSPTIAGDVPRPVWDVLSLISSVKSMILLSSTFGSFGWSGEATSMLEERLKGLHIRLHKPSLKIKLIADDSALSECEGFGSEFADALQTLYSKLKPENKKQ
ncbi:MAG: FprA family A-type flavoprotein [Candidatus Scalindua sp. SCAELEC01]|nr:FprA family A-type flavoprotein [Planctomycetota bacterium]RZV86212.1 MAG: FprA family A-type flavoprotein [Candidatus Scalindua sp. SCAELEC01]